MALSKIAVVVLVLVARTCRGEIVIATPSRDESVRSLVDDVAEVVASCYGDQIQVGLFGDVHDDLVRALSQHFIPAVVMDSSPSYMDIRKTRFHHKLNVFIAEVSSVEKFEFMVEYRLKSSIWWNNMASFFIFDRSPGCDKAKEYLIAAWISELLNVKILCDHIEDGPVIMTFNPYTSKAPTPWRRIGAFPGVRGHPLTLLYRKDRRNRTACINLDFDKTEDLGGFPTVVEGFPLGHEVRNSPNLSKKQYWRRQDRIVEIVSRTLNTTLFFSKSIDFYDIVKEDTVCSEDGYELTYPFEQVRLVIISQFRGHKSQLNKIYSVIDVHSRIGLSVVYLITLIFLKFIVRQALVPAFLNLVRITCDSGLTNLPDNTASRIYMTSLLFFAVTIQGIYQGNLAALLTQQIPLRQIETIQDLVDFDYKVYSVEKYWHDHPNLGEGFTTVAEHENCVAYVTKDSSAACIWITDAGVLDLAREFNLHISSEPVELRYMSIESRVNWVPLTKVDAIMRKLVEGDMLEIWKDKCNPTKWSDFQIDAEVRKNKTFKNLELSELAFSFIILGIGLLCATITFIFELAIQYKCVFVRRQIIN